MPIPSNITAIDIYNAIKEIDEAGVATYRESTSYDLLYIDRRYPPKYVISLANKYANNYELDPGEFNGGVQANNFLRVRGFKIINKQISDVFPLEADSWEIISRYKFKKKMDKSAFLHQGTGIPIEIRDYFDIVDMHPGEKRNVKLIYRNSDYRALFVMDRQSTPRTRLFWKADFDKVIKEDLSFWFDLFSQNVEVEERPLMLLERNKKELNEYRVLFLPPTDFGFDYNEEQYQSQLSVCESSIEYLPPQRSERSNNKMLLSQIPRSSKEGCLALSKASFTCELDSSHMTFKTEQGQFYMEKHHLIPMEYYYDYKSSIDHYSNIYSLCPTCHRRIHYGSVEDKRKLIEVLFNNRRNTFKNVYGVELKKILFYYDIE
jgi:5-methylcytosine-specific restriction protein A